MWIEARMSTENELMMMSFCLFVSHWNHIHFWRNFMPTHCVWIEAETSFICLNVKGLMIIIILQMFISLDMFHLSDAVFSWLSFNFGNEFLEATLTWIYLDHRLNCYLLVTLNWSVNLCVESLFSRINK